MTKYLIQHGSAKGVKIETAILGNYCDGIVFSPREETIDSIQSYCNNNSLNPDTIFYDPQFYYSRYDTNIYKNLDKNSTFPLEIKRKDWRTKSDNIINFLDNHAKDSKKISLNLITPSFYIDSLDWKFDHSLEIYNYCKEEYKDFKNYYLSLVICEKMFHSKNDVDELLEDINDEIEEKDGIYFFVVHENVENNSKIKNYEYMDEETLSNILYFIHKLQDHGFKILSGYNFMNSVLYAMLNVEYVSGGWFNTLRKFSKDRFENIDTFGIRKKRYTSIPLLSYFTGDLAKIVSEKTNISFMLSGTSYDDRFISDFDSLSFVDYEQQFWIAIYSAIEQINSNSDIKNRIDFVKRLIVNAISHYDDMIRNFPYEEEISNKLRTNAVHLNKWLLAIELFEKKALII